VVTLQHRLRQPVIIFSLAVLVILITAIGFHNPIDRQMHAWKLLPEPERLTELYFTHPNSLASSYTPGQAQTVNFTVHNLEYRTTTYQYQIVELQQGGTQATTLATGSFTLSQNAYKHQSEIVHSTDLGQNVKVEVRLVNVHESIDYLLNRSGA
jgi:uncharacterized membrane protein